MIPTVIKSVDIENARYPTLGDYFFENSIRYFQITNTGEDLLDDLIFLHEFIEEIITRHRGIKEEDILKHDLWVEEEVKAGRYPDDAEPGEHEKSPYRREHLFAEKIEKMVAKELKINWDEYSEHINKLL